MDIKPRGTVPIRPTGQTGRRQSNKGLSITWKIVIASVLALAVAGLIAYQMLGIGSSVDRSKYQAVFLTNGQVYFGKLRGWESSKPTLTDVYYFQADNTATSAEDEDGQVNATNTQTLIKLGEEIHKPSDKLVFNRDAILFVENIEDDGQVVEAINDYQSNQDK